MKTLLKNLFLTGFFVLVVSTSLYIPSAKAQTVDYVLLCEGIELFLKVNLSLEYPIACLPKNYTPDVPKTTLSACAPFTISEIDAMRTFLTTLAPQNCSVSNPDKKFMSILCKGRLQYDPLKAICEYYDNPNTTTLNALKGFTQSEGAGRRGSAVPEIIAQRPEKEDPCELKGASIVDMVLATPSGLIFGIYVILRTLLLGLLKMFQYLLTPSNYGGYINFLNTDLVETLWAEMLKIANLGIIFGMIIIAIATIFKNEKFGWKKNLPKLLVIALLVNFSLVIVGMFVDMSNYLSNVAMRGFSSGSLPELIVDKTICPTVRSFFELGFKGSWWKDLTGGANYLRAGTMGLIMTGLFLFQFVGLLLYVVVRIATIIICLITSPLAFLGWAIPGGGKIWDFWRQRIQHSLVSLPILCLTLYFSLRFIQEITNNLEQLEEGDIRLPITLMYALFIIAFVQLVRYVAKFLGVGEVEKGFQFAKKAVNTVVMAGAAAVGGIAIPMIMESKAFQKVGEGLTHVPLLSGVGQQMMMKGEKNKADRIAKYQKEYEGISLTQLKALDKTPLPSPLDRWGYERRIGLSNQLAKIGELGGKSIEFIKLHQQDKNFDQLTISRAVPQDFRITNEGFGETGPTVKDKVQALGGIKENKILELTQAKEFIEDQVAEAKKQAKEAGKTKEEIELKKVEKFNEVIQEIVRTLNPAQLNAFWRAISAKTLVGEGEEEGWGGLNGKIMKAIDQLDDTKKKFREEMLPLSRALEEISGVKSTAEKEKEGKQAPEKKKIHLLDGTIIEV